ncbi:MAG: response regulator [Desulfobacterales bacterium]|jgi:DNA-binding response OmpR family regulator/flavodoxin
MEPTTKILVVDDEKGICQNVEKILKKNNYEVTQAVSAQDALEKMARESFALLISDIVMPGKNGLELLKLVKKEWPLTKAIMMTAYASTDTAMKAIRLGALDYVPKPFTPAEMRSTVEKALSGALTEAAVAPEERDAIEVIDIDLPFDAKEVADQVGQEYMNMLGRSDMPIVEVKISEPLENFCEVGSMVCDIFKKLGATCKAGTKTGACPQKKAKKKEKSAAPRRSDPKKLIGIDMPFDYEEVSAATGPEYVRALDGEGVAFVPYEELKQNVDLMMKKGRIDVDMPFDRDEVAAYTGDKYTEQLTRSDVPVVEITADQPLENFCDVGSMVCDIFKKLGATCKAGTKTGACPQKKAKKGRTAAAKQTRDLKKLIAIDQPYNYDEVVALTGPEFVNHLYRDDTIMVPYDELKANVARLDAEMAGRAAAEKEAKAEPDQMHVLVIDDEVAVNNNVRKILKKKGYRVDQATSKAEALEKIDQRDYRLVLLDLKMPGVKGLELLEAIRTVRPQAKVIIITGYASIETAVQTARMGAVDYVPKPFTPDEIRSATENAVRLAA